MAGTTRRHFCTQLAGSAAAAILEPLWALARETKPIRIKAIDVFPIVIPASKEEVEAGVMNNYLVARVDTDTGIRGYAFAQYMGAMPKLDDPWGYSFDGPSPEQLNHTIRPLLVGKDLFAITDHVKAGLIHWGGIEFALWDAIGKLAGVSPSHRLLGGSKSSIKVYLTCVWRGKDIYKTRVPYAKQAEMAVTIQKAGFKAMKIRAWRPRATDDADACGEIRARLLVRDQNRPHPGRVLGLQHSINGRSHSRKTSGLLAGRTFQSR